MPIPWAEGDGPPEAEPAVGRRGGLSGIQERSDVLCCPLVFGGDGVRVVTGHVHRRPPEASLFLAFGYHGVQGGGLEVPQRMEVDVLWKLGCLARLGKGVSDRIGVRRDCTARFGREHEASRPDNGTAVDGQSLLFASPLVEPLDRALVERNRADTR